MKMVMIQSLSANMIVTGIAQQRGNIRLRSERTPYSNELQQWLASVGVTHVYVEEESTINPSKEGSGNFEHASVTHLLLQEAKQSAAQSQTNQLQSGVYLTASATSGSALNTYIKHVRRGATLVCLAFLFGVLSNQVPRWWLNLDGSSNLVADKVEQLGSTDQNMTDTDTTANMNGVQQGNAQSNHGVGAIDGALEPGIEDLNVQSMTSGSMAPNNQPQTATTAEHAATDSELKWDGNGEAGGRQLNPGTIEDLSASSQTQAAIQTETEQGRALELPNEDQPEPISPELLAMFEQAIVNVDKSGPVDEPIDQVSSDIPRIDQIPARLMTKIPSLAYNAHMYASEPLDRWININDLVRREGDIIEGVLTLVEITPQHAVLAIDGYEFTLRALTDW